MGVPLDLTAALKRSFGYPGFRPGQEGLIRAVMEERDALGILPTGGGKSVCFQLPALLLPGMVLVVSPLISLMEDQTGRAREVGLRADFFSSATPEEEREGVLHRALGRETDLLLVAPERFQVPSFRALLPRLPVSLLAVDEAHCISHWGHDFRPDYLRIGEVRDFLKAPVMALTATATPRVRREMETSLRLRAPHRVVGSFDRPNLGWEVQGVSGHRKKVRRLVEILQKRDGATIIYASTRRTVEAVRREMASFGLPALAYHAGLPASRRTEVQGRFLGDPTPVVVATNAFGMGIDRPDVRLVLHYQLSGSMEAYYQEAGRAGRDGEPARCLALHGPRDEGVHRGFLRRTHPPVPLLRKILGVLVKEAGDGRCRYTSVAEVKAGLRGRVGGEEVEAGLEALVRIGAVAMEGRHVHLEERRPDFHRIDTLRKVAEAQLQAVLRYARGGQCRRRILLEYFGEEGSPPECGRCDWCEGWGAGGGRMNLPRPLRSAWNAARAWVEG